MKPARRVLRRAGLGLLLAAGLPLLAGGPYQPLAAARLSQPVLPPFEQKPAREERLLWQQRLHWSEAYEQRWRETHPEPSDAGLELYALEGQLALVRVETYGSGWQPGQLFYVYDRRSMQGQLLSLAWIGLDASGHRLARQAEELAGQAAFEARDQVLRVLALARRDGDCGELIRWRFYQGRPLLKEVRARLCSDEAGASDPATWPRIWP